MFGFFSVDGGVFCVFELGVLSEGGGLGFVVWLWGFVLVFFFFFFFGGCFASLVSFFVFFFFLTFFFSASRAFTFPFPWGISLPRTVASKPYHPTFASPSIYFALLYV